MVCRREIAFIKTRRLKLSFAQHILKYYIPGEKVVFCWLKPGKNNTIGLRKGMDYEK